MMLRHTFDELMDALDSLQVTEAHCINLKREWTTDEQEEYKKAKARYGSALINAMCAISEELKAWNAENGEKNTFCVKCYEEVQGEGPICWYGEQEYRFDTREEAQEFIDKRRAVLGKQDEEFTVFNEDGAKQYLVTLAIGEAEEVSADADAGTLPF